MIKVHSSNFGSKSALRCTTKIGKYFIEEHIHQFPEIVFVKAGTLDVIVDGKHETAKEKDIVFINSFQIHTLSASKNAEIWICVFSNDFINDFENGGNNFQRGVSSVFTPSVVLRDFLESKIVDSNEKFIAYDVSTFRRLKAGIYAVFEEYTRKIPITSSQNNSMGAPVLQKTVLYLSRNFKNEITLESVAHELGYNPEYISHALSSIEKINFRGLLNSFRMDHAKNLLISTNKSIPQIAQESGFSSERSFHRIFKEMFGTTPGNYRKKRHTIYYTTVKSDF